MRAGIALVLVGIQVFRSIPAAARDGAYPESYSRDYLSLLAIAAANPLTIIFFITILRRIFVVPEPAFGHIYSDLALGLILALRRSASMSNSATPSCSSTRPTPPPAVHRPPTPSGRKAATTTTT